MGLLALDVPTSRYQIEIALAAQDQPLDVNAGPLPGDVEIPGGIFQLGSSAQTPFLFDNEKWAHPVRERITSGALTRFRTYSGLTSSILRIRPQTPSAVTALPTTRSFERFVRAKLGQDGGQYRRSPACLVRMRRDALL